MLPFLPVSRRSVLLGATAALLAPACEASPAPADRAGRRAQADLYACEGCEGIYEGPNAGLDWQARIAAPDEPGERLRIIGTVFQPAGRTPAAGVTVYAYHTDAAGLYSRGMSRTEWSRRHGLLRGWVCTGADGRYAFDTIKPGIYPNRSDPAHVHLTVLEPGRRPYWIDDLVFAGEFGVDDVYRRERENRGGSGIVSLDRQNGIWRARRDIELEPHP